MLFPQSGGHFDHLILSVPFSLHGFPAPFRRRFPALPCGVIAVYPMQTVFRLSRFGAGFGNKKTPHNNLNLTIPSGMALYFLYCRTAKCSGLSFSSSSKSSSTAFLKVSSSSRASLALMNSSSVEKFCSSSGASYQM